MFRYSLMTLLYILCGSLISAVFSARIDVQLDLITTTTASIVFPPCKTDRDCPDTDFCFLTKKPICISCFNCSTRNRQNGIRCAKTVQDCGDCLPGFISDTWPHIKSWCIKPMQERFVQESSVPGTGQPQLMNDIVEWLNMKWIAVFIIFGFTILGFSSYIWYNKRNDRRTLTPASNMVNDELRAVYSTYTTTATAGIPPPPSYRETMDLDDDVSSSYSFQLRIVETSMVDQKAIPYIGNGFNDVNPNGIVQESPGNSAINDNVVLTTPSGASVATSQPECNVNIHDENTTPSFWTPGENYGVETVQLKTNNGVPVKRKQTADEEPEIFKKKKGG